MTELMDPYRPLNFKGWIEENRHLFKPPVGNKLIWENREFDAFVVGGPNTRTDYHYNEGEEFFYQVEGDMVLKIHSEGKFFDIPIKEGEIYLLPPRTLHSPQRFENTIGLVIERKRQPHEKDGLVWFCQNCGNKLYEEYFHLKHIVEDLPPVFDRYYSSEKNTTCSKCQHDNNDRKEK